MNFIKGRKLKIYESKSGVLATLIGSICIAICGVIFAKQSSVAYFVIFIGIFCALMCLKKKLSKNYIEILDDKIILCKNKKTFEIFFKDLKEITLKTIDKKRDLKAIYIIFKKIPQNADEFLRIINDTDTILAIEYEKSKYEICNILKEKLSNI